jgi:RNA recognition motif-containing protein
MQGSKVYVGNLSYSVTSSQLGELFAAHGTVKDAVVITGKGFGFVEMSTPEEAQKAIEGLNGTQFEGRTLNVDVARPPQNRDNRERSGFRRY